MKLTPQQIAALLRGVTESLCEAQSVRPLRFPAPMRPIYEATEGLTIRMNCNPGVRLCFTSNSRTVRLGLRFGAYARACFNSAILIDGKPHGVVGPAKPQTDWQAEVFRHSTAASRSFDIWLPHMAQADITCLELEPGAEVHPVPTPQKSWLAYGDSITQGMTTPNPTHTQFARCALGLGLDLLNFGVGGAKLDAKLAETVPDRRFDVISIAYGTNDFNQSAPLADYAENTKALIRALRAKHPGAGIVLITPLTWAGRTTPNNNGDHIEAFRAALSDFPAAFPGLILVDGSRLIPDDESCFVDKVHPNAKGFEHYAEGLLPALKQALSPKP